MESLKVKIINRSPNPLPSYGTPEAAGMDVYAWLPEGDITLQPGERALIGTGLFMELPRGYECQVRPRSGLALRHGISIVNSPGTIDADYRGEIGIILINLGQEPFTVTTGERICQIVVKEYVPVQWHQVDEIDDDTERGDGGFGHTGTH